MRFVVELLQHSPFTFRWREQGFRQREQVFRKPKKSAHAENEIFAHAVKILAHDSSENVAHAAPKYAESSFRNSSKPLHRAALADRPRLWLINLMALDEICVC